MNSLEEKPASRYVVGIDLGTTNSAVAYVDTEQRPWQVHHFPLGQLVAAGEFTARDVLPSFHFQPSAEEARRGGLRLPWSKENASWCVGTWARDEGIAKPSRSIASAKSWLCHTGVDRTADLLPWQGAPDVERLSPVEVTARFLSHLRDVWDDAHRDAPLALQDVVVTLPASFDEVARELTIQAARRAQLPRITLIEEPQAAFYAWVDRHAADWRQLTAPGQKILVCDIGGGTTDFTLIRVRAAATSGETQFHRVAVGEHLILGGDNLDLALARAIEAKLLDEHPDRGALSPQQWDALVRVARRAKETLLGSDPPDNMVINLPSSGSRLIGGSLQISVNRADVENLLAEGFLPACRLSDAPQRRRSGFQELGLPYAADPAITRYLAAFLTTHRTTGVDPDEDPAGDSPHDPARPDVVLLNGGFFYSPLLRQRLLDQLTAWFSPPSAPWSPILLDNPRLDLAVAQGAAYYGMVRRGEGVGIVANLARSYYIGVADDNATGATAASAVCLVPGQARAGDAYELSDQCFQLTTSEPVEFPLYASSTRLADSPGTILPIDLEQMSPLPPIRTVLHASRKNESGATRVCLAARLTEIGSLELSCREVEGKRQWTLQFDVRSTTQTDLEAHASDRESEGIVDEQLFDDCRQRIAAVFGPNGADPPASLVKEMAIALGMERHEWPTSLLRRIWEVLYEFAEGRRRSAAHEARWLNLVGFALRPGYGYAVDDWRVAETWRLTAGKLVFAASQPESQVVWRRIAGGLSRGAQASIADPFLAVVRQLHRRARGGKASSGGTSLRPTETAEIWRLLGSFELLDVPVKTELGAIVVDLMARRSLQGLRSSLLWALGRLGQRVPTYGPLNTVAPTECAAEWLQAVLEADPAESMAGLAAMQLARRTGDRHRDLDESLRTKTIEWLERANAANHWIELVRSGGDLDLQEQSQIHGESLPRGLRLGAARP